MNDLIIAPSILSLDYSNVDQGLEELMKSKAKWLHFDVMDGHFVPNLTFGPDIMNGFKKKTGLFMDVHIMVDNPDFTIGIFKNADMITFHYEAADSIDECKSLIKKIRENGIQAGISIKPKTSVEVLDELLPLVDMILIMSVEPGFGGQKFIADSINRIEYINKKRKEHNYDYRIEVDGGINADTAKLCVEAGADTLVAGSYVFKADIQKRVESLICLK